MLRRTLTAALAAAVMLTALPAPAQEIDRRIRPEVAAAALFGIATLAVLAHRANRDDDDDDDDDDEDDRKEERVITRHDAPDVYRSPPPRARNDHARGRGHGYGNRGRALAVPVDCARRVEMWGKRRTAFGTPCLRQNGVDVARLPHHCAADLFYGDRKVVAYGATCLHDAGVRIK